MGEFIFEPRITKEYIEKYASQEQLMYRYTGLVPKANKLYKSPFRKEDRASCSFYIGKSGDLLLRDFGVGTSLSWVNIIMRKYSCSFWKALRIAAEDLDLVDKNSFRDVYKLIEIPKVESSLTNLQVQIKDFTEEELDWWNSYGVTESTLNKYNVFSIQTTFINGVIHTFSSPISPIFGYYFGKKDDIEVWKIYLPKNKNKGYRFLTNAKESVIQGWKQLPKTGDIIVITKALKDVMLFNELGIAACAPNSETVFLTEQRIEQIKQRFKKIYICFDNDSAGISAMRKLKKQYPEFTYTFIPRKYSKDISDFCKRFGKDKTRKFVYKYLENEKTNQ
jgi:5S rRNA maturation endonuclease (ribonuclease M5)